MSRFVSSKINDNQELIFKINVTKPEPQTRDFPGAKIEGEVESVFLEFTDDDGTSKSIDVTDLITSHCEQLCEEAIEKSEGEVELSYEYAEFPDLY